MGKNMINAKLNDSATPSFGNSKTIHTDLYRQITVHSPPHPNTELLRVKA